MCLNNNNLFTPSLIMYVDMHYVYNFIFCSLEIFVRLRSNNKYIYNPNFPRFVHISAFPQSQSAAPA